MAANATAIWRVRISGSNTNGGGYDPGIAGAGTDYSQQNAAQVSQSSTANTSLTATTTLQDTGASFTSALIANGIWISGTGFTTYFTFITAVPSSTTLTLQTAASATGSAVSYNIGGGWADPFTNMTSSGPVVAANTIYILGSGTPNPSSYVFDYNYSTALTLVSGSNSVGQITWANDPATPGYKAPPDTTGGMPTIQFTSASGAIWNSVTYISATGLWFIGKISTSFGVNAGSNQNIFGCVWDQGGFTGTMVGGNATGVVAMGCEQFSSVAGGGSFIGFDTYQSCSIVDCNIHDTNTSTSPAVRADANTIIMGCIVAKSPSVSSGIGCSNTGVRVINNTVDGNGGDGIAQTAGSLSACTIFNNIISNHTTAGKFGINCSGSLAADNATKALVDYNVFYNNTSNYNNISAGPHDTALVVTPYVGSGTENYQLA